ncbi:VWA domain-containing protein [Methanolacinia paynteri]|uniref:VWA domain-containing protein n=1 Tax=Methanolacinia paynteri TaxID=230356 RepID=UPI00064E36C4|nr:VWA domain-containing protein [Methanolacinia paynteri]
MSEFVNYPFPAIVGNETAKKAILCTLVNEDIKGLLITGSCGSAKTVLARSASTITDDKRIRIVPQNTTEDRLFGSIDIEKAITEGNIGIVKGILAESDCQIVVADDINLLDEKIVHGILNTADTGSIILERDGFSEKISMRYILTATMDPDEGELSPQILDRFDICIETEKIEDESERSKIIRNCLAFEKDSVQFLKEYSDEINETRENIRKAKERLPYVMIPESLLDMISELCIELNVSGQRGDIALAKTAKTLAAIDGRDDVVFEDIKLAALMTLEHRRRSPPDGNPPQNPDTQNNEDDNEDEEKEEGKENEGRQDNRQKNSGPNQEMDQSDENDKQNRDQSEDSDRNNENINNLPPPEQVFDIGSVFSVIEFLDEKGRSKSKKASNGRRRRNISKDKSGHYFSYRQQDRNKNDIAIDASLRAAAPFQVKRDKKGLAIKVDKVDLREKIREKKTGDVILFLVDASGSMGVRKRMVAVKGAILSLLNDAYQKRDMVGLMIFRKNEATLLLPPTRSTDLAYKLLKEIPTGGRTPLSKGLIEAAKLLTQGRYSKSMDSKTVVILTDGRANTSESGKNSYEELKEAAEKVTGQKIKYVVVDTEEGFPRMGLAVDLAFELDAIYLRLDELDSSKLAGSVGNIVLKEMPT